MKIYESYCELTGHVADGTVPSTLQVSKTMDVFAFKTRNSVLKTRKSAFKTMNFV